ncbi:hypothetical protein CFC21_100747 [Triticum aestivum]|uniref:Uncharacterized protein n=2 Tax=Triticum aestivum TaxID=4565 RepID=A0A9R1M1L1_WHEAT|nr:hypothetical protein CFC21_100747 [Triticum aestivum]
MTVRGQLPGVHSGRRVCSAARRPLRSCRPGGQRFDSDQFLSGDLDSRCREISLGKRHVDCTVGSIITAGSSTFEGLVSTARPAITRTASSVVQMVDRSIGRPSALPAGVHFDRYLVGAPSVVNRPRVVPFRVAGAFGRPTPLAQYTTMDEAYRPK